MNVERDKPAIPSASPEAQQLEGGLESFRDRWRSLKPDVGMTTIENILIIGAALVILLAVMAWFFPQVFQQVQTMVTRLLEDRSN